MAMTQMELEYERNQWQSRAIAAGGTALVLAIVVCVGGWYLRSIWDEREQTVTMRQQLDQEKAKVAERDRELAAERLKTQALQNRLEEKDQEWRVAGDAAFRALERTLAYQGKKETVERNPTSLIMALNPCLQRRVGIKDLCRRGVETGTIEINIGPIAP